MDHSLQFPMMAKSSLRELPRMREWMNPCHHTCVFRLSRNPAGGQGREKGGEKHSGKPQSGCCPLVPDTLVRASLWRDNCGHFEAKETTSGKPATPCEFGVLGAMGTGHQRACMCVDRVDFFFLKATGYVQKREPCCGRPGVCGVRVMAPPHCVSLSKSPDLSGL